MSLIDTVERIWCGWTGHPDTMREAKDGRLYLRCGCGWRSPGIQVCSPAQPRRRPINLRVVRRGEQRRRTA